MTDDDRGYRHGRDAPPDEWEAGRVGQAEGMRDLTPTTERVRAVAAGVREDQLDAPTPMPGTSVRELLNHLLGLAVAFRDAAAKLDGPTTSIPPAKVTEPLPDAWQELLDMRLVELAAAWVSADAWTGMTKAGGVDLPGEIGGLVALDEVLLHGWDLARATGQAYDVSDGEADAVLPIVTPEESDPDGSGRGDLFGAVVAVPADAPPFDRVLGLAGRKPDWSPAE
jgi:uncharacterized protein (TIGR03086 family)